VLLVHLQHAADVPVREPMMKKAPMTAGLWTVWFAFAAATGCSDDEAVDVVVPGEPAVLYLVAAQPDAPQQVHAHNLLTGAHRPVSQGTAEGSRLSAIEVSSDGRFVAYAADHRVRDVREMFVADLLRADPPRRVPLPLSGDVGRIALAPHALRAAVLAQAEPEGLYDLFLVDLLTLDVQRLTRGAAPEVERDPYGQGVARWSPDGSLVAFTADHHVPNARDLYVASADGSDVRRLTDLSAYDQDGDGVPDNHISVNRDVEWSADGEWLYYHLHAYREDWGRPAGREVWAVRPSGTDAVRLYPEPGSPIGDEDGDGVLDGRVWGCTATPTDGSRYAFTVHTEEGGSELHLADASASATALLAPEAAVGQLAWSPHGESIAFVHPQDHRLWRAPLGGADAHPLGTGPAEGAPGVRYNCGGETIRWSPDAGLIAYVAAEDSPFHSLYLVPTDGSPGRQMNAALAEGEEVVRGGFSPDGRFLIYSTEGEEGMGRLFSVPLDAASDVRELTVHLPPEVHVSYHFVPLLPVAPDSD
jgi:Tol biopolymer transport system component